MNEKELKSMAHELVAEKIKAQESFALGWAVQEIIVAQGEMDAAKEYPMHALCARQYLHQVVKKAIDKYGKAAESAANQKQIVLPGFESLYDAYTFKRDGEIIVVVEKDWRRKELEERRDELKAMGQSCIEHAREIDEYIKHRDAIGWKFEDDEGENQAVAI